MYFITVPVTNTSSNINFDKKSYSLSCSDTTSKPFLSTVSMRNTSCNGNSNDKSCSSSYSKVFSADVKDSSFKNAELILLED